MCRYRIRLGFCAYGRTQPVLARTAKIAGYGDPASHDRADLPIMRKSLRSLAALLAVPLLGACLPSEPPDRFGVTLRDGRPTWVFAPGCSNEDAIAVVLLDGVSRDANRIWEARAVVETGPISDSFAIGEAPAGYEEVIELGGSLAPDQRYLVRVLWGDESDPGISSVAFTPSELAADEVVHLTGSLPTEEFRREFACGA